MAEAYPEVRFDNDQLFVGDVGFIDESQGVIRGASLIKKGEAEGHGLLVDDHLLSQIQASGKSKGKVPINLDHGTGITSTCGFISGFRIDGDKLRGDIHLLKTHPEYPVIIERAARMPDCFGLSTAFLPEERFGKKGEALGGGRYAARCSELKSVDLVCRPAANAGLFSVPEVDSSRKSMAKEPKKEIKLAEGDQEPTMAEILTAIQGLGQRLDEQDQFNQQVVAHLQGGGENDGNEGPTLQDLVDMDDAELERLGLTRAEVDSAVAEVLAGMEGGEHEATGPGEMAGAGVEGVPAGAMAGAGASAGADASPAGASGGATSLASLKREIQQLKTKQRLVELSNKREAEEIQFAEIEQKILVLAKQRDDAIALAEQLEAKCEALEVAVKTGTRPVKAGVDNGMRMFSADGNGELHEFQQLVKSHVAAGKTEGEAIRLAVRDNPAAHQDWLKSQAGKPLVQV